jgi:hypothetical protein
MDLNHPFGWMLIVVFSVSAIACSPNETTSKSDEQTRTEASASAGGDAPSQDKSGDKSSNSEPVTAGLDDRAEPKLPGQRTVTTDESIWVPPTGEFVLQDTQTGTLWNLRGEAYRGELAGERLEQLPAFNAFWFAWSVFYDGSELWNRDIKNTTAEIRTGDVGSGDIDGADISGADKCLVPCDEIRMGCPTGKDCIPALSREDGAEMVAPTSDAADYLTDNTVVLGVLIDGQARAYPHNILWWHEIYNDRIGETDFAVTFCPLTGSGIVFEGRLDGQQADQSVDFGVSGRLYNSNLVMYDQGAEDDTFWVQMIGQGVKGPEIGQKLERLPVVETTWAKWKQMHPDTLVVSSDTGHSRDYSRYPYADFRTDDSDTHQPTNPDFQGTYRAKDRVLGLVGESTSRAYAFPEMQKLGDKVVVNDTFEGQPIVVAFEGFEFSERMGTAIPFSSQVDGSELTFVGRLAP